MTGLTDDLWGDEPPRNPRGAVQMLVSRIRSTAAEGLLESTATGYRIAASDLQTAEQAGPDDAEAALALWSGEPGADLDDGSLGDDLTVRARRARSRLLRLAAERLLDAERPAEAVPLLAQLAVATPLDGAPVGLLMRAQAGAGHVDAALATFADHRERLADALGADPDPALVRLNTELLRGQSAPATAELVGVRAATTPLLGRDGDLARLVATVPAHRLTSIVGTGGLGKTRLAHESALRLADRFEPHRLHRAGRRPGRGGRRARARCCGRREVDAARAAPERAAAARPAHTHPRGAREPPDAARARQLRARRRRRRCTRRRPARHDPRPHGPDDQPSAARCSPAKPSSRPGRWAPRPTPPRCSSIAPRRRDQG